MYVAVLDDDYCCYWLQITSICFYPFSFSRSCLLFDFDFDSIPFIRFFQYAVQYCIYSGFLFLLLLLFFALPLLGNCHVLEKIPCCDFCVPIRFLLYLGIIGFWFGSGSGWFSHIEVIKQASNAFLGVFLTHTGTHTPKLRIASLYYWDWIGWDRDW